MLRFERTGRLKIARNPEGIKWAKEVTEYLKANYSQASFQVYTELFGDFHAVHWHVDAKDLTTWDNLLAKLMQDQQYLALTNKGMAMFIEGSFKDSLMNVI